MDALRFELLKAKDIWDGSNLSGENVGPENFEKVEVHLEKQRLAKGYGLESLSGVEVDRLGKKPKMWKGKGKWMGLASLSIRSPGGIVIGQKRKTEKVVSGIANSDCGDGIGISKGDGEFSTQVVKLQPIVKWIQIEKNCKKIQKHKQKVQEDILRAGAQDANNGDDSAQAEEVGQTTPPTVQ